MPDVPEDKPPLPEPFAPTGPKLSRFFIHPAPPIRPHLFRDEARFVLRLSLLAFGTELAAWVWLSALLATAGPGHRGPLLFAALQLAVLRMARPLWAQAGTRLPRTLIAFALLALALVADGAALFWLPFETFPGALGLAAAACACLPSLGDVAASCAADAITVERRAAAFSWLSMGQGAGLLLGVTIGSSSPRLAPAAAAIGLLLAGLGVPDLRDRGTPRSAWSLSLYREIAQSPLARELCALAAITSGLAGLVLWRASGFGWLAPLLGMVFAARAEPRAPNAVALPRLLALLALVAALLALAAPLPFAREISPRWFALGAGQLALFALGAAASALPSAVARAAGEMERPITASLVWTALFLGGAAALAARALSG